MRKLKPERKLRLLAEYMNEFIDAWPQKIKTFDSWADSKIDKHIKKDRHEKLERERSVCAYCRNFFDGYYVEKTKDHIIPISRGGLDKKENRLPCCQPCNKWKSDKLLSTWLREIEYKMKKEKFDTYYGYPELSKMIINVKRIIKYVKENENKVSQYRVE